MGNGCCTLSSDTKKLVELIGSTCNELKAIDTKALDISGVSSIADAFIVTSARSDRHAAGIAQRIMLECEKSHIKIEGIEGIEQSHWILIDLESVVVHIFYEPLREHYNLEELWSESTQIQFNFDSKAA